MTHRRPQIRIVRWGSDVPDRACCTVCNRLFSLFPSEGTSVQEARDELERMFLTHVCTYGKAEFQAQTR